MDRWSSGDKYEPYVGRWSRLVAPEFVDWLGIPAGRRWLDVGSGTGALSETVLARCAPESVVGVEPADSFRSYAVAHVTDPRVSFVAGDAQSLPFDRPSFDVVVSGLVLNFVPDYEKALHEMRRVADPGATIAAYVWDYGGEMQLMTYFWDAAAELDPALGSVHEGLRFAFCRPEPLRALFAGAGLSDVAVDAIVVPTVFTDFDDYWSPFLGGQGPAPAYVTSLDEQARGRLRDALRARLPVADDGSIPLHARAWAVRGTSG